MANIWALRTRMFFAILILFSVLFFFMYLIFWLVGFDLIWFPLIFTICFVILQWGLSSWIIGKVSRVTWIENREQNPMLWDMVTSFTEEAGVKIEKFGISEMPVPNAFVYGIFNSKLVVTQGLLNAYEGDSEALEGVIWHEIGHVKHGDLKMMMLLSTLPMLFYMIAYSLMWSRSSRSSSAVLIGAISFGLYFLMNLGILLISRYREYLADDFSSKKNGDVGIIRGLAKITYLNKKSEDYYNSKQISLKAFFIVESPHKGNIAYLDEAASIIADDEETKKTVLEMMKEEKKKTGWEIFRTHPYTVNRIISLLENE